MLAVLFDSVGFGEWLVLLAVVLIVVGPKRLPETARKIGGYYSKFRRAAETFKRQLLDMDTTVGSMVEDLERNTERAFQIDEPKAAEEPMAAEGADGDRVH